MDVMRLKRGITEPTPELQAIKDGKKVPKTSANSTPRASIVGIFDDYGVEQGDNLEYPSEEED